MSTTAVWTLVSPTAAFVYLGGWMVIALALLLRAPAKRQRGGSGI